MKMRVSFLQCFNTFYLFLILRRSFLQRVIFVLKIFICDIASDLFFQLCFHLDLFRCL